ncbi:polar amino acid ABC transporter substrate-binding protein [Nitratireductor aestuarii]|uniref:Polar amino acid ABC transporter substrate-binding protein n=1 Tax=Nitratireductor aestuarii TaxID=1735103 RepID=A0A916W9Z0_9HYPH|nr:transporter substrate-binding domain-containing protein [Nitratireductor aestuarii]GGA79143.1 polar amino acid ABC transporter substrate-binding protein [Nitratireductor aestuarii]
MRKLSKILLTLTMTVGVTQAALAQDSNTPMRVASDVGFAPFTMRQPDGQVVGFIADMGAEIAKRTGRPSVEIVDVKFSAIFAGLFAKNFEFIITPLGITPQRTEEILFTEGYMQTGLGFMTKATAAPIEKLEDLKGRKIAINRGTSTDTWITNEQADTKYGFEVQRYDGSADAIQAVASGRADAYVNDLQGVQYTAKQVPNMTYAYEILQERTYSTGFRYGDEEARNKVERAIECMKQDGTLSALNVKWFGAEPAEGSAMTKVSPGYGPEGMKGWVDVAEADKPGCN